MRFSLLEVLECAFALFGLITMIVIPQLVHNIWLSVLILIAWIFLYLTILIRI